MDQKYNLSVAIIAVAGFAISTFTLGQTMSLSLNTPSTLMSQEQEAAAVSAESRAKSAKAFADFWANNPYYECTYPGGAMFRSNVKPAGVTGFSYNTGTGPTVSTSGSQGVCYYITPTSKTLYVHPNTMKLGTSTSNIKIGR